VFSAYGDGDFTASNCPKCEQPANLMDPVSVSVTAERLLYRSQTEPESGDYSLSIVIGVMAVESYLTRLFLKLKGIDWSAAEPNFPTVAQEAQWEKEYPRSGGFSGPIGFVSQRFVETTFDKFVEGNAISSAIFAGLPHTSCVSPTQYFNDELFKRRNRIAHWGYVDSNKAEAELCHAIAVAIVTILREMDRIVVELAAARRIGS
jgi:hypothetical protein